LVRPTLITASQEAKGFEMSQDAQETKAQETKAVTPAVKVVMDFSQFAEKFATPASHISILLKPDATNSALAKKEVALVSLAKWIATSPNYKLCNGLPGSTYDVTISKVASPFTTKLPASLKVSEFPVFIEKVQKMVTAQRELENFYHPKNGEVNPNLDPASEKVVDLSGLVTK